MGQEGKRVVAVDAQKTGDRNRFFSEGEKIYREPIVLPDPSIAALFPTNRAYRTNKTEKINPSLSKGFLVFPNINVFVMKYYLYFF